MVSAGPQRLCTTYGHLRGAQEEQRRGEWRMRCRSPQDQQMIHPPPTSKTKARPAALGETAKLSRPCVVMAAIVCRRLSSSRYSIWRAYVSAQRRKQHGQA